MKKNLEIDSKHNQYFVEFNTKDKAILCEVSLTFVRLFKTGNFDLNWLKSKVTEIYIKK